MRIWVRGSLEGAVATTGMEVEVEGASTGNPALLRSTAKKGKEIEKTNSLAIQTQE